MILALCYYETDSSLAPNIAVDSITLEEIDASSSVVSSTSSTELTIQKQQDYTDMKVSLTRPYTMHADSTEDPCGTIEYEIISVTHDRITTGYTLSTLSVNDNVLEFTDILNYDVGTITVDVAVKRKIPDADPAINYNIGAVLSL